MLKYEKGILKSFTSKRGSLLCKKLHEKIVPQFKYGFSTLFSKLRKLC